jgi:ComF family protein
MGGKNVKNTMIERLLQIIAPHPCSGCGKVGSILCQYCKYDIIHDPFVGCILCGKPEMDGICKDHNSPISRAFVVGTRDTALETVINKLKFQNAKQAARSLAELLHASLPLLPKDIQVISIPTVRSHVRQRGYDHMELIVRHFTALRHLSTAHSLIRVSNATQHTVGKELRKSQSKSAFKLEGYFSPETPVLLIDDVVTTGSTVSAAAELLRQAGATVWVAALAYQPLD